MRMVLVVEILRWVILEGCREVLCLGDLRAICGSSTSRLQPTRVAAKASTETKVAPLG